ncbi:MAG: response regulator transcription factor [Elusimicrobia bacterium]|nr:response regulator transcription factor [Elusimicrobiota bacterium]
MAERKKCLTVLIADDQTLFREGIKDLLEDKQWINVVGEAMDGEQAVEMTRKFKPDIVLMDIKLPKLDGVAATRKIKQMFPNINILMLSSFEDDAHVMESFDAGANGYLSKMLPAVDLVNDLRAFTNEGIMIPQHMMNKIVLGLKGADPDSKVPAAAALTKTEVRVLNLLGAGKCNKDIAGELEISVKTIKNHLNNAFQKLGAVNRTEAVVKAIERGIISPRDEDNTRS